MPWLDLREDIAEMFGLSEEEQEAETERAYDERYALHRRYQNDYARRRFEESRLLRLNRKPPTQTHCRWCGAELPKRKRGGRQWYCPKPAKCQVRAVLRADIEAAEASPLRTAHAVATVEKLARSKRAA